LVTTDTPFITVCILHITEIEGLEGVIMAVTMEVELMAQMELILRGNQVAIGILNPAHLKARSIKGPNRVVR
jgi:hypothetical protein